MAMYGHCVDFFHIIFHFQGSNGPQKFCIDKVGKETHLPRTHTWYATFVLIRLTCYLL